MITTAGLWRFSGEGTTTFRWSAPTRDSFIVLEGEVIEIDEGPILEVTPGSIVSLPPGVGSTWHVTKPYKDLFVMAGTS